MSKKDKRDKQRLFVELQSPRYQLINWLLLFLGVVSIALGFWFLSKGSITLAPILMVLGYCVLIPIGLILKLRKPKVQESTDVGTSNS